ncbi:hypothetical protein Tco_1291437 [Tanacetum coccineum]
MSNTNNSLQTQTSNALHNAIMEACGKDRPPLLAPGSYNQPYKFKWTEKTVPVAEGSSETTTEGYMERYKNVSQDIRNQLDVEAKKAIERLKQGEPINVQDLETNLYWEFGKFTSKMMKIYKPTNNNLRTSSNTNRANQDNTSSINRGTGYDNQRAVNIARSRENVARECQKPKRAKGTAYHKEKMLLCKQEEAGFQLNAEQVDWRDNTDDELKRSEIRSTLSIHDTYSRDHGDTNITTDSLDMSNNRGEDDQDEDEDLAKERDLLASLIEKLKCEIDENKDRNKLLESSNKNLIDKLKSEIEDFKIKNKCLESSNNLFKESNTELAKNNQLMFKDLKKFQAELDSFVKPEFLMKAQRANPRLYDIGCYNDNLALMLAPESDEMIRLAQESRSKLSDLIKPFDYKNLNNLYDLFVPQREKSPEQRYFSEMSKMSHTPVKNENSKESFNKQTTLLEKRMDKSISWVVCNGYSQKDKNKAKNQTKPSTGLERAWKTEAEGAKDAAYHKEKMLLCKQEEAGFQLNAEQDDWRDATNDEPKDLELEAHYLYMTQIQEVTPDATDNSGPIFDADPLQKVQNDNDNYNVFANDSEHPDNNGGHADQDEDDDLAKERDLLASLIDKLKCEIDESNNHNKLLELSNKNLVDKLKDEIEDFKTKKKSLE